MSSQSERGQAQLRSRRLGALLVSGVLLLAPFGALFGVILVGAAEGLGGLGPFAVFVGVGALGALGVMLTNLWLLLRWRHSLALSYFDLSLVGSPAWRLLLGVCGVWLVPPLAGLVAYYVVDLDAEACGWLAGGLYAANWVSWLLPAGRTLGDYLAGARVARSRAADAAPSMWSRKSRLPDAALMSLPLAPVAIALPWLTAKEALGAMAGGGAGCLLLAGLQWGLRRVTGKTWAERARLSG